MFVHRGVANRAWESRPQLLARRRGTACLGVFAIIFQAILYGWHSHPLPVPSRSAPTALSASVGPGHGDPDLADDDCQICFAIGHHNATPIDLLPPLPPRDVALPAVRVEQSLVSVGRFLHFRSRAPPRV